MKSASGISDVSALPGYRGWTSFEKVFTAQQYP